MYIRCIGSETISVIDSGAVNRRFESRSGNKRYDIDISCFSSKHTPLRKEDTDGFGGIRIMCQESSDIPTWGLLYMCALQQSN